MKKTILVMAALIFLSLLAFAQDEDYYGGSFVRLTYVKGDVVVQRAGDLGSEAGVANLAIVEGDQVETKDGRAEISFGRRNYLRVDNDSLVEFSNLPRKGDDRVRLHLLSGNIYLRINRLEEEKTFEVHTPDASFYVLEEGLYRVDARANRETELTVLEGSMEAAGEGGSQLIGSRERIIAANGQLASQLNLSYGRDDFDYWNEDRDAVQSQYVSKRYLPSELDDYEGELANNGYWAYERPYGNVWVPYVHSYVDWRPYYYGYWNWYPLCGWTWVPYEPWGWAVYHYGRWGWRLGLGWYWIPHHAWGPGWVHWYWGHDHWGWSPLSWYNYPCVLVNNHFYDRYHGAYYPGHSRALTIVHKSQLQNRRIHSVALSRSEASRLGDITMQARQPDIRPTVKGSALRDAGGSKAMSIQPKVRPSSLVRGQNAPSSASPSRVRSSSLGQGRALSGERPSGRDSSVSSKGLSRSESRSISARPSTNPGATPRAESLRSKPESSAPVSSSPRRIRSAETSRKNGDSSSPSAVRSYSSSSRVSSSRGTSTERPRSVERGSSPRVYSPSSSITRYGSSYGSNSSRSQGRTASVYGEDRSISRSPSSSSSSRSYGYSPSPSISRSTSRFSSPSRSYSGSSSRSVFSAPRSSSSSRGSYSSPRYSYSSPSTSSSTPRFSSPSRSYSGSSSRSIFSAPRSSSSSRGSYSSPSISRSTSRPSSASRSSSYSRSSSSSSRSSSSRGSSGGSIRRKN